MVKRFGKGSFKAPPEGYKSEILLVSTIDGNVYKGNAIATAHWTKEGFLLLKDSLVKQGRGDTIKGNPGVSATRNEITAGGLLIDFDQDCHKLKENILLPSPSYAAKLVHGNDRNGQITWTSEEGTYLKYLRG